MTLRVLVLTHQDVKLPKSTAGLTDKEMLPWMTEYDVVSALQRLGHEPHLLGGVAEMAAIRSALLDFQPDIVFNLLEEFRGEGFYVPYVLGYCELMHQPFTGCNPSSLLMADNKALTKKILRYHRIPVPAFALFAAGRAVRRPGRLSFPLIVKSNTAHGSAGIAQASVVENDKELVERVEFVHNNVGTDAIAEQYIDGKEMYMGILGNQRLQAFPLWELRFDNLPEGVPRIATEKVKWDLDYQEKRGIATGPAGKQPAGLKERIVKLCKRVYRILNLNGYARMDVRVTDEGKVYLLEPNPNPDLAMDEDFPEAADSMGLDYDDLIQRILNLGLRYHESWRRR